MLQVKEFYYSLKEQILNVGMLLTGSEVSRELRSRLLDIVHDVEEVIRVVKGIDSRDTTNKLL